MLAVVSSVESILEGLDILKLFLAFWKMLDEIDLLIEKRSLSPKVGSNISNLTSSRWSCYT